MSSKPPIVFPQEQTLLTALGERLRLARLRRKLSTAVVAQRAGMSRTSVYKVEAGDGAKAKSCNLRPTLSSAAKALKSACSPSTAKTRR